MFAYNYAHTSIFLSFAKKTIVFHGFQNKLKWELIGYNNLKSQCKKKLPPKWNSKRLERNIHHLLCLVLFIHSLCSLCSKLITNRIGLNFRFWKEMPQAIWLQKKLAVASHWNFNSMWFSRKILVISNESSAKKKILSKIFHFLSCSKGKVRIFRRFLFVYRHPVEHESCACKRVYFPFQLVL